MRGWIKRLERASREDLDSFELLDGSRYYYEPKSSDIFMHMVGCIKGGSPHNWPEPPEVLRKLREAKDIENAVAQVRGEGSFNFIPYDLDALIQERTLKPRPIMSRYDPGVGTHIGIDPYEYEHKDLSEQAQSHEDGF